MIQHIHDKLTQEAAKAINTSWEKYIDKCNKAEQAYWKGLLPLEEFKTCVASYVKDLFDETSRVALSTITQQQIQRTLLKILGNPDNPS